MNKVIYDFGSNNGDDIPYYLLKSDIVVAIEANPDLCQCISDRFNDEIAQGRVILENCVINTNDDKNYNDFYIHKKNHVKSQIDEPDNSIIHEFDKYLLPSKSVRQIIHDHGDPFYIKIDLEGYDGTVLKNLLNEGIIPPYISAESHSIDTLSSLICMGYPAFKLVKGKEVADLYSECQVHSPQGVVNYSFPHHSAGPFGNDINSPWMSAEYLFRYLAFDGWGWKDIHASMLDAPDTSLNINATKYYTNKYYNKIIKKLRKQSNWLHNRK